MTLIKTVMNLWEAIGTRFYTKTEIDSKIGDIETILDEILGA